MNTRVRLNNIEITYITDDLLKNQIVWKKRVAIGNESYSSKIFSREWPIFVKSINQKFELFLYKLPVDFLWITCKHAVYLCANVVNAKKLLPALSWLSFSDRGLFITYYHNYFWFVSAKLSHHQATALFYQCCALLSCLYFLWTISSGCDYQMCSCN